MNDLTFALRQLRKSPRFTSVAVITIADCRNEFESKLDPQRIFLPKILGESLLGRFFEYLQRYDVSHGS